MTGKYFRGAKDPGRQTAEDGGSRSPAEIKMLDMTSTQFDSFLFWRQPVAALDLSELEDLGLSEPKSKDGSLYGKTGKSSPKLDEDDGDMELSEFSSFNYWKEPIASIDTLDFSLLLL
ncbi:hypothetical protein AMELA_G00244250 [Ameiurus melas]|uniref:Protein AF1q n=1 Tax=Ameiurus melas TaxID=219545 RepID=A0A7J5ZS78_AMEME|nr:hypothetical protein AMELA_G00244250 [Ameiurus melas]